MREYIVNCVHSYRWSKLRALCLNSALMWLRRVLYRNIINLFWPITARTFLWTFFKRRNKWLAKWITGSPSFSYEMITLRNKSHGEGIRACMRIFTTALWNKTWKYSQIFNENTSPYVHNAFLVFWPLTSSQRGHFRDLSFSRIATPKRKTRLHTPFPNHDSKTIYWCQKTVWSSVRHSLLWRQGH